MVLFMGDGAHDIAIATFCPATGIFILSLKIRDPPASRLKCDVRTVIISRKKRTARWCWTITTADLGSDLFLNMSKNRFNFHSFRMTFFTPLSDVL